MCIKLLQIFYSQFQTRFPRIYQFSNPYTFSLLMFTNHHFYSRFSLHIFFDFKLWTTSFSENYHRQHVPIIRGLNNSALNKKRSAILSYFVRYFFLPRIHPMPWTRVLLIEKDLLFEETCWTAVSKNFFQIWTAKPIAEVSLLLYKVFFGKNHIQIVFYFDAKLIQMKYPPFRTVITKLMNLSEQKNDLHKEWLALLLYFMRCVLLFLLLFAGRKTNKKYKFIY